MVLLQLLIEDRIRRGADPYGRDTPHRIIDILADWDSLALTNDEPGLPWNEQSTEARAAFRAAVESADPLVPIGTALTLRAAR